SCAQITVLLKVMPNVTLTHAALSTRPGSAVLATRNAAGRPLGGGSRLVVDLTATAELGEEVAVVAVDDIIPTDRRVAAVHLDVEGATSSQRWRAPSAQ